MPFIVSHPRKGAALLTALLLTGVILIMALYLLEKLVPASRDVRGIENGTIAFYHAETGLESALSRMNSNTPGFSGTGGAWSALSASGFAYAVTGSGLTIPRAGLGNSEYDKNWNTISLGAPVQVRFFSGNPQDFNLYFRVPVSASGSLGLPSGYTGTLDQYPIIQWSLSSGKQSFTALDISKSNATTTPGQISAKEINEGTGGINLKDRVWKNATETLSGSVTAFYSSVAYGLGNGALCSASGCVLKLSIISPLIRSEGGLIPKLEYRIDAVTSPIPSQYARVTSEGYSNGFRKTITENIRQTTTNEALDFTVFQ